MNDKKPRAAKRPAPLPGILKLVQAALDDLKAVNICLLDVRGLTDVTDFMAIASGNSDRHVRSIADRVQQLAKANGVRPFGVEGARDGEWVLVDLPDVMVHVMLPRVREFYALEELWDRGANTITLAAVAPTSAKQPAPKPRKRRAPARKPG